MKIYTMEMRSAHESCPICGKWHSSMSCPPPFPELIALRSENEHLIKILRDIARALRSNGKDVFADAYLYYIAFAVDNIFSGGKSSSVQDFDSQWLKKGYNHE